MRRSRKPLSVVRRIEGSNPSPSASRLANPHGPSGPGLAGGPVSCPGSSALIVSRSHDPHLSGWRTQSAWPDRETAERDAASTESAAIWIDGEDVSERAVTVALVLSEAEVLERFGPEGLAAARASTEVQREVKRRGDG